MAELKVGRYLFYALGEILLVVIGILIALQVNNWNEVQKEEVEEIEALQKLRSDLARNSQTLTDCINYDIDNVRRLDIILDHLKKKLPYSDSLNYHFAEIIEYCSYDPVTSTYDNLRSSKGLDLIKSDSIRKQIIEIYDVEFPFANENMKLEEDILNQELMLPLFVELFEIDLNPRVAWPLDYHALFENQKFINALKLAKDRRLSSIEADQTIKDNIVSLLKDIDDYLK